MYVHATYVCACIPPPTQCLPLYPLPPLPFHLSPSQDADKHIMKHLKEKGRLVHQSQIKHSYPFCWRSETPLIYRAVPSWFIRVESIVDKLLANNKKCYWWVGGDGREGEGRGGGGDGRGVEGMGDGRDFDGCVCKLVSELQPAEVY